MAKVKEWLKSILKEVKGKDVKKESKKESSAFLASSLSSEALETIRELSELGPRPAATKDSRKAARKIANMFEAYSDDVTITAAKMYPNLSRGFLLILAVVLLISFVFSLFKLPYLSLAIIIVYLYGIIKEVKKENSFLRRFLSTNEGANVHATLEPEDVVLRTIIFSAHHDSAEIIEGKKKSIDLKSLLSLYIPFIALASLGVFSLVEFISMIGTLSFFPGILKPLFIVFHSIILIVAELSIFLYFKVGTSYSIGAGDNLSGVSVVVALLHYFSKKKERGEELKNTRLIFVSFDGEECGAQGSAEWLKNNSHLFISPKLLNFDGLYKADQLAFLTQDGNGMVTLDAKLASKCSSLATLMGHKIPTGKLGMLGGETDAASAAIFGMPATTLTSMKPEVKTPAHTAEDTPDKVEENALKIAIAIGAKLAEDEDSTELQVEKEKVSFLEEGKKYRLTK